MALNTRSEYALRALLEIADGQEGAVSAKRICDRQGLPKKYIERLLRNLKAAEIISSSAGAKGGYVLARSSRQISLAQILTAVEDDSLDPTCSSGSQRFCPSGDCSLKSFFNQLGEKIFNLVKGFSLADIHALWKEGR